MLSNLTCRMEYNQIIMLMSTGSYVPKVGVLYTCTRK